MFCPNVRSGVAPCYRAAAAELGRQSREFLVYEPCGPQSRKLVGTVAGLGVRLDPSRVVSSVIKHNVDDSKQPKIRAQVLYSGRQLFEFIFIGGRLYEVIVVDSRLVGKRVVGA
jgi:hypothetical protein